MASLGVGIIGVNPDRGWARESHVPAVQNLPGLELVALASRRRESAEKAAAEFGARRGYGDPAELIADPEVDLVGVAASVPAHRELILAAARAGKHVYSEWPLGVDSAEADEIAAATSAARIHTAIGLQARTSPAVMAAARAVQDGVIGRPLHVSVLSTTMGFGPVVPEGELYLEDPATGMNLATIQLAHTLDIVGAVLGPPQDLAALLSVQFPDLAVGSPARPRRRTMPDHALVQARLAGGVPVAVEVVGGRPPADTPFRLDVAGDRASLSLVGGAPRGVQSSHLTLLTGGEPARVDEGELAGLPTSAFNVASVYATLRDDITACTHHAPDFEHARRLARLVDDIRIADGQGRRISSDDWPQR